ncbi:hypothetical protein TCAL_17049 [Tigriopus californicus]|uniref:Uncharacterized protein n=1 Tax=Tigriopus californicus TaxID=6832 RepID=A0A553PNH3_TIGCA|nr:uncharacterized protein LOC131881752 [Tigriopus californicus]XP_059084685.1 uncharacterized protein LOC131881752 [Tigriopus californicus]TRY79228.1 hypothetical protein TCAL_17049 [Tigriopus californicus]
MIRTSLGLCGSTSTALGVIWLVGLAAASNSTQWNESSTNCFALANDITWRTEVLVHDPAAATLGLNLPAMGPDILECLESQQSDNVSYLIHLMHTSEESSPDNPSEFQARQLQSRKVSVPDLMSSRSKNATQYHLFELVFWPGIYHLRFCSNQDQGVEDKDEDKDRDGDEYIQLIESQDGCVEVGTVLQIDEDQYLFSDCDSTMSNGTSDNSNPVKWNDTRQSDGISFGLRFRPCLSYESSLTSATNEIPEAMAVIKVKTSSTGDCQTNGTVIHTHRQAFSRSSNGTGDAVVSFELPQDLPKDQFYCLEATLPHHPLCANLTGNQPHICGMHSHIIFLESRSMIAQYIPFCTSHFSCGWLYIAVVGMALFSLSCVLAICCVYPCCCLCCCRRRRHKKFPDHHRNETIPFEGLCLHDSSGVSFPPKKTWVELHSEWDRQPPKNPGKILLLYSPDTKLFKDLQNSFKSFLEEACHCSVLDLFDEELFQTIAFDPELWLSNLLHDPDFKIVIICSEGAYKRQQALLKGEVLNIPSNTTMDGLFSAGIKFIQDKHAYDYNRLALARYEMLSLSGPEFRLQEMVPNREFLVPTQLHELFCWIHGYNPLDLLGKPWDRYHLELQLLQDDLKAVRRDGRPVAYQ